MKTAIVIFLILGAALSILTVKVAHAGTSDGDYMFIFPAGGAAICFIIAGVLAAIHFF